MKDPTQVDIATYEQGMSLLVQSGIFDLLKERAKIRVVMSDTGNYLNLINAEAHRSIGYHSALDELFYFREKFLNQKSDFQPSMNYGSVSSLQKQGRIDAEQSEQLKRAAVFNP